MNSAETTAFLDISKRQFLEWQEFFKGVSAGTIGKPDPSTLGPGFPPAHDSAQGLVNADHGVGEMGTSGGLIVSDFTLAERKKRLKAAIQAGAALGVPEDMMTFGFLLGKPEFNDGKDVADPADPNPLTPSFFGAFPYLSNYAAISLQTYLDGFWASKLAGLGPSGGK